MSRMAEQRPTRLAIVIRQGPPRGDLFELEQATYYDVVDCGTQQVILTLQGETTARLSRDTGLWDEYRFSGVEQVALSADERSILVSYHDGRQETVSLPLPETQHQRPSAEGESG